MDKEYLAGAGEPGGEWTKGAFNVHAGQGADEPNGHSYAELDEEYPAGAGEPEDEWTKGAFDVRAG